VSALLAGWGVVLFMVPSSFSRSRCSSLEKKRCFLFSFPFFFLLLLLSNESTVLLLYKGKKVKDMEINKFSLCLYGLPVPSSPKKVLYAAIQNTTWLQY